MGELIADSTAVAFAAFVIGLAVLLVSANYFVDAIAALAAAFGVPPLVIGMTVVAFGTSTPELVVNMFSAYRGETALAFGNIVGACILNTGVVLAVTAIVRPLRVEGSLITREIPMLLVAILALLILGYDGFLSGTPTDDFTRADGLILLLLFAIFVYYTAVYSVVNRKLGLLEGDVFLAGVVQEGVPAQSAAVTRNLLISAAGLLGVSIGADWTVKGATGLARFLGLEENIIGLTIVSLGTTLPELATCILAARRGNADIALGNVVGSNLFNILAIGGLVSVVRPVAVPPGGHQDLFFMAILTVVLLPIAIRSGRTITRGEGVFLLSTYVSFLIWRLATAS